ncbi:MSMEG_1061 family FMN-dependent PPOX-type flavoprotein [Streptomyces sp. NPDC088923]|uniref:MSMEG_1061 family FMN-dependent PPOX-type flavoprotein n=1 Tax=Streptomyces sp. NPDC088923 TaxID=3365913 RepID=UPI0038259681
MSTLTAPEGHTAPTAPPAPVPTEAPSTEAPTTEATPDSKASTSKASTSEIRSPEELSALLGEPWPIVIEKVHDRLAPEDLDILARAPFCVLSTSDEFGNCDASPRGDLPGFTHVVDASTIALPERPGNRRGDSLHNILRNPHVGLLYLIPGGKEVLRVNGRARVLSEAPYFDAMTATAAGKALRPALAIEIAIDEIFLHCPQSLRRAALWK